MNRLDIIATLIHPCPAPDIAGGYDMCPAAGLLLAVPNN